MHAAGLASLLKGDTTDSRLQLREKAVNNIKVCDEVCTFSEADSNADVAKCRLAKLSTVYSDSAFNISQVSEDLKGGITFGTLVDN